jgi:hypothetical protein
MSAMTGRSPLPGGVQMGPMTPADHPGQYPNRETRSGFPLVQ